MKTAVMRFFAHRLDETEELLLSMFGHEPRTYPHILRGALYVENHQGWVWCGERRIVRRKKDEQAWITLRTGRYVLLNLRANGKVYAKRAIPVSGKELPYIIPLFPRVLDPYEAEGFDPGQNEAVVIKPRPRGLYHVRFLTALRWPRKTGEYAHLGNFLMQQNLASAIWQTFAPPSGLKPFIASRAAVVPESSPLTLFNRRTWGHPIQIGDAVLTKHGVHTIVLDNNGEGIEWTARQLLEFAKYLNALSGVRYWYPDTRYW